MLLSRITKSFFLDELKFKNFRDLTAEEIKLVFEMRNNISIRENMANTDEIDWNTHLNFIKSLNKRKDRGNWIMYHDNKIIGVITFSVIEEQIAEIGNYLNYNILNKGYGLLLNYYTQKIGFDFLYLKKLTAHVKETNKQALKIHDIFLKKVIGHRKIDGISYIDICFDNKTWQESKGYVEGLLKYID